LELVELLEALPEALPSVASLPLLLPGDAVWYPPIREALVELEDNRHRIMTGSVKSWLSDDGKVTSTTGEST